MKRKTALWFIGSVTFAGAAACASLAQASYPVVIWGVGYAAVFRARLVPIQRGCPLVTAQEETTRPVFVRVK